MGDVSSKMTCCSAQSHPWDEFAVVAEWLPADLCCLVVGESPGDAKSAYFYDQRRRVAIRTIMLRELCLHGIIAEPTLTAIR